MKFGHFDDARKEYVITTPQTPLPWINYLGSEDFFSLVSNTAGGYSFYRDARMRRLTRYRYNSSPLDMDGHHIYIKDGDTVWNPGWQPTKTELDSYACRHGLGYTILEGEKNGVSAAQELFVPTGDACELDRLTLKNKTDAVKELDVFSYVEFCLWDAIDDSSNFQRNFSTGEVEVEPAILRQRLLARGREQGKDLEERLQRALAPLPAAGLERLVRIDNSGKLEAAVDSLENIVRAVLPVRSMPGTPQGTQGSAA